jgi:hypothetical protein
LLLLLIFSGDLFGMGLAWLSLLPIFIIVGFITLILFRRDLHTVSRKTHKASLLTGASGDRSPGVLIAP